MASASGRKPSLPVPTVKLKRDVLVMVAMDDEFLMSHTLFGEQATVSPTYSLETSGGSFRCFNWEVSASDSRIKDPLCGATVQSGKCMEVAAASTIALVAAFQPNYVVVLGLSGGIKDVLVGDVFIPNTVHNYLSSASVVSTAASGAGSNSHGEMRAGGNRHSSLAPIDLAKLLSFTEDVPAFASWLAAAKLRHEAVCKFFDGTAQLPQVNFAPMFLRSFADHSGHLASASVATGSQEFAAWLASHVEQQIVAVDMESGAVVNALLSLLRPPRVLVVRGISNVTNTSTDARPAAASIEAVVNSVHSEPGHTVPSPLTVAARTASIARTKTLLRPLLPYVPKGDVDNGTVRVMRVLAMANATTWLIGYAKAGHLSDVVVPGEHE